VASPLDLFGIVELGNLGKVPPPRAPWRLSPRVRERSVARRYSIRLRLSNASGGPLGPFLRFECLVTAHQSAAGQARFCKLLRTITNTSDLSAVDRVDELPAEATTEEEPQLVAA
jgi:hypothetical protein